MITIDLSELVTAISEGNEASSELLTIVTERIEALLAAQNTLLGFIAALLLVQIFTTIWGRH